MPDRTVPVHRRFFAPLALAVAAAVTAAAQAGAPPSRPVPGQSPAAAPHVPDRGQLRPRRRVSDAGRKARAGSARRGLRSPRRRQAAVDSDVRTRPHEPGRAAVPAIRAQQHRGHAAARRQSPGPGVRALSRRVPRVGRGRLARPRAAHPADRSRARAGRSRRHHDAEDVGRRPGARAENGRHGVGSAQHMAMGRAIHVAERGHRAHLRGVLSNARAGWPRRADDRAAARTHGARLAERARGLPAQHPRGAEGHRGGQRGMAAVPARPEADRAADESAHGKHRTHTGTGSHLGRPGRKNHEPEHAKLHRRDEERMRLRAAVSVDARQRQVLPGHHRPGQHGKRLVLYGRSARPAGVRQSDRACQAAAGCG